jgi:hypothetical protein
MTSEGQHRISLRVLIGECARQERLWAQIAEVKSIAITLSNQLTETEFS